MRQRGPIATDIVLLGAGTAHLEVLRRFAARPLPGVRLTLVVPEPDTPWASLLPALIRGDCSASDACIDLARCAAAAGARLILAEPAGIDLDARMLQLAGRPALPFDLLSADLNGESAVPDASDAGIPCSPSGRFLAQLPALEAALPDAARVAIIGGGIGSAAAGDAVPVELALALARCFRGRLRLVLVTEAPEPMAAAPASARRAVRAALVEAGVELVSAVRAGALTGGRLALSDGSFLPADVALWAGGRRAPGCLAESGLACDAAGRVLVNAGQRSVSHSCVFAAGDCAAHRSEHSSGRLLAANLRRAAQGRRLSSGLRRWGLPQVAGGMADLGSGRAVAWCSGLAAHGAAVWRGKHWLDRHRMQRYAPRGSSVTHAPGHVASPHPAPEQPGSPHRVPGQLASHHSVPGQPASRRVGMRKAAIEAGGETPDARVGALSTARAPDALVGLGVHDRLAVLNPPVGQALVQCVASLRTCLDDPFVFGQIAAAHALSDLHAMGAQPWTALAIAASASGVTPRADVEAMLAGASDTLFTDGCTLVGAHRVVASEASLGLVLSGLGDPTRLLRRARPQPGDVLLLTKPLGTGIVLAAHQRGVARGRWLAAAIEAMRASNAAAAGVLRAHGATACIGVGERGLLGHLDDMLRAAGVAAVLWPDRLPALPGALELVAAGVAAAEMAWNARVLPDAGAEPHMALLADPQISGGLLAAVPPVRADACLAALREVGLHAAMVGVVEAATPGAPAIRLEPGHGDDRLAPPVAAATAPLVAQSQD